MTVKTSAAQDDSSNGIHQQLVQAERLPHDLMLMKIENDQIFSMAKMRPRDPEVIVKQLKALIDAYPAAADEAIYLKPVGTEIQIVCGDCKENYTVSYIGKNGVNCPKCNGSKILSQKKVQKFAEGLSIRAAESIRSVYGYTRLAVTQEMTDDGKAIITGTLVDYAAGNFTSDQRIVSPWYMSRHKQLERHPEDRFLNVLVKAEKSKLRRDVILDSVPNMVKAAFRDYCETKLEQILKPEFIENKIIPYFKSKNISTEQLEKIIGRTRVMGWTQADMVQLRKIKSALENEETTVSELLDGLENDRPSSPPEGKFNVRSNGGNGSRQPEPAPVQAEPQTLQEAMAAEPAPEPVAVDENAVDPRQEMVEGFLKSIDEATKKVDVMRIAREMERHEAEIGAADYQMLVNERQEKIKKLPN